MSALHALIHVTFAFGFLCNCTSHVQTPMPVSKAQAQTTAATSSLAHLGENTWITDDGETFPFTSWLPENGVKPEIIVIGVHGLSGAADDYRPMGKHLIKDNNAVYSYELRGQGNDPVEKRRGDIDSPDQWFADLNTFIGLVRHKHPNTPLFLYGESLGSLIVTHGQSKLSPVNQAALRGIILASPIVGFREPLPPLKNFIAHLLIKFTPWMRVSLETLAGNDDIQVTADTTHEGQMAQTPHFVKRFTFRLLGHVETMIHGCKDAACKINKPLLILYPGHDYFTDAADVNTFFDALPMTDKEKQYFPDSFHLLLHDKQSDSVLETLDTWLTEKAAP